MELITHIYFAVISVSPHYKELDLRVDIAGMFATLREKKIIFPGVNINVY